MSGIEKPIKVPLIIKRGKSAIFTVQPLKEAPKPAQQAANEAWRERDWESAIHDERDNRDFLLSLYKEALATGAPQEILDQIVAAGKRAEAVA